MKTTNAIDCGNAPKRALLRDLTIQFASYQIDKVMENMDENITWTFVGEKPVHGKEAFSKVLQDMRNDTVSELQIEQIITHGKEAVVRGKMLMDNGNEFAFADFYEFNSAGSSKVKKIVSFVAKCN